MLITGCYPLWAADNQPRGWGGGWGAQPSPLPPAPAGLTQNSVRGHLHHPWPCAAQDPADSCFLNVPEYTENQGLVSAVLHVFKLC